MQYSASASLFVYIHTTIKIKDKNDKKGFVVKLELCKEREKYKKGIKIND